MPSDIERWDDKYRAARGRPPPERDPVLGEHAGALAGRGLAMDVACGRGQDALFLASLGYRVVGIDGSFEGLRQARASLGERPLPVTFINADLDRFAFPEERFDVVAVIKYLNRRLIASIKGAVKPGGLVFYRTFNRNHLEQAPSFNESYVLEAGELASMFEGWSILATNDSPAVRESLSYLLARRPSPRTRAG